MDKAPKVGDRIKVKPDHRYYPCEGVVTRIWVEWYYDADDDDPRWDDHNFIPKRTSERPESEWKVSMKVDHKPKDWSYGNHDTFCPDVSEIEEV